MNFQSRFIFHYLDSYRLPLDNFLTGRLDSAWEREKREARKMLVNRAEFSASSVCGVGWLLVIIAHDFLFIEHLKLNVEVDTFHLSYQILPKDTKHLKFVLHCNHH